MSKYVKVNTGHLDMTQWSLELKRTLMIEWDEYATYDLSQGAFSSTAKILLSQDLKVLGKN